MSYFTKSDLDRFNIAGFAANDLKDLLAGLHLSSKDTGAILSYLKSGGDAGSVRAIVATQRSAELNILLHRALVHAGLDVTSIFGDIDWSPPRRSTPLSSLFAHPCSLS